jgi:arsenate reductase-like glutaredoxin family protein
VPSSLLFSSLLFSSLLFIVHLLFIKKLIETCKSFQVEPSFFKRLKEELSHDEMIELLHQSPDQAKKFGLSKKKFKQLQEYSTYLGII